MDNLLALFTWMLNDSAKVSILIIGLLLVKFLLRNKLSVRIHYALWLVVFISLVTPWTPASPISIYNLSHLSYPTYFAENQATNTAPNIPANPSPISQVQVGTNDVDSVADNRNANDISNTPVSHFADYTSLQEVFLAIWLLGMAIFGLSLFRVNQKFSRRIQGETVDSLAIQTIFSDTKRIIGIGKRIAIVRTSNIASPSLYGLFRPQLLMPMWALDTLSERELKHVFLHELMHYKRKDILINWVAQLLLVIHWFNPLMWYALFKMHEDQEISCDALALKTLGENETRNYAYTLIKQLEYNSNTIKVTSLANLSASKSQIRRRVEMVKGLRKFSVKGTVVGLIVVLIVILATATKAQVNPQPQNHSALSQPNLVTDVGTPVSSEMELKNKEYGLEYLNIKLPAKWQLVIATNDKFTYGFNNDKGQSVGQITVLNYDPSFDFQRVRPNHASLVKDEVVNTSLGQASLYTMDADNGTAASGVTGTHYDYYALISIKDKAIYELELRGIDKNTDTKQQFINILKSLRLNTNAVSKASNFDPDYKLEVKVIDKSAPQGVPAKSELWITYSNGREEKLVSPHIDADATKTIIDIKSVMTSRDKTKVYFATFAWATSDAIHMVNLVTKSEKYVTDGSLLQITNEGKYKDGLLVQKSKPGNTGRYTENVVVDDNGNVIATLSGKKISELNTKWGEFLDSYRKSSKQQYYNPRQDISKNTEVRVVKTEYDNGILTRAGFYSYGLVTQILDAKTGELLTSVGEYKK